MIGENKMKKLYSLLLVFCLVFLLSACKNDETITQTNENDKTTTQTNENDGAASKDIIIIPDLLGMDKNKATELLEDYGLIVTCVDNHLTPMNPDDPDNYQYYPNDQVVEQELKAGTVVSQGTSIELRYASETTYVECYSTENGYTVLQIYNFDKNGKITIPKTINGNEIQAIAYSAITSLMERDHSKRIKELSIPNDVEIVGKENDELYFIITTY